jgi:hypothetical protein
MLKPSYSINDIIIIKLITGEEIIAKLIDNAGSKITISKPCLLGLMQGPGGQANVGIAPWCLGISESDGIEVESSKWIFLSKARKEAKDQYMRATSSLQIADSTDLSMLKTGTSL